MTDPGQRAETWKPVEPIDGCSYSGYEASDLGRARSVDRAGRNGRPLQGRILSTRPHEAGYVKTDMRCDTPAHKRPHTLLMHTIVLTTFDRPRPPGMEACHGPGGPADNRWPESGLHWGTSAVNEREKPQPSAPPDPTHPCRNAPACPNLVIPQGRRCLDCVAVVGREAAGMLRAGRPLQEVAEHFGYTGPDWVYSLAVKHGDPPYTASKAEARTQRPPLTGFRKLAAKWLKVA